MRGLIGMASYGLYGTTKPHHMSEDPANRYSGDYYENDLDRHGRTVYQRAECGYSFPVPRNTRLT